MYAVSSLCSVYFSSWAILCICCHNSGCTVSSILC